ncbi:MAG: PAS domain-containing protein, partial [Deltaproteobacteria bacterium]|nr:PAS domain-containing protein [Deltaproteobacteria bacterium]
MIPAFWKKLIRYNPQKERDARRNLSTLHFYLLAVFLSVFFTLVVLSFWFTWQVKKFYGGDSYTSQVLNIASDIRNYSQNMVMQSLFVHNELMLLEDKDFLEDKLEDAKEAFYFFSYGHFQLQGEADGEQIPAAQKETLEALFVQIDPHFRSIEDAFHSYGDLFKDDIFDQQKASREIRKLIDTVVEYLNVMERIVREYTLAGEVQARKNMWMVLPLHLGILLLVLSLYWPVMRRVRHSISDLARANKQMQEEISKRQLSERERDRLAMAVEQAIDGIIVSDDKGNIRYANKTMTNFCECEAATSDNWHNSVLDICVLKDDGAYTKVEEALRTGKTWQGHITRENNQGLKQELMLSVSPVMEHLGGIKGFIGMLRDITTEHELEGQLRQAQKLEAVGVLAGGVAHDFNNMLQVIGGYAELSLKHAGEHEGLQKGLNKIIKSVKSASSLTKRLLAFSRKEVLKKKPLNFNRFIEEQISLLKRVIRADIDIEL